MGSAARREMTELVVANSLPWETQRRTSAADIAAPPLVAVLAGIMLGLASGIGDELPWYAGGIMNAAGPWLIVAFAVGALAPRAGIVNGALALATAVVIYYGYHNYVTQRTDTERLIIVGQAWMVFAVIVGSITGGLGGWWRSTRSAIPVGLLAGALIGEAALTLMHVWNPWVRAVVLVELGVGAALPLIMAQRWWRKIVAYALAWGSAGITMVAIQMVDEFLATIRG